MNRWPELDSLQRAFGAREEWTGRECIRILRRRKTVLAAITGLGIFLGLFISAVSPRVYQSRAGIEIQGLNDNFLDLKDIYPTAVAPGEMPVYVQTQADIMQQDALLEEVARRLDLGARPEFQGKPGVLARLRQDIKVAPLRNSRVIQITCDARSAALAADLCNTLGAAFIEQSMEARRRAARQTYESLVPQLDQLRRGLRPTGGRASLQPGAEASRRYFESMLQRANDAWIASNVRQANARLVSAATPAKRPYKPNLPLNLAIGMFGGMVLATGWIMLQEQNPSVLRVPGDAGMHLTLPELGAIPKISNWNLSVLRAPVSTKASVSVERAALEERSPELSESFRATLASILSARNGDHPRTLVVTSPRPTEGKTTIVSNLGIALAEISSKVLLIDGDMRRSRLHKVFEEANSWGLSDVLREKNAIEELPVSALVRKTAVSHVYLLPSGASTDNIFGLLCSDRMPRLLARFREEFDYVLVDAPPCLEFADARLMARHAEELLLVVRADYTDRRTAQAAVERLRLDGISVAGVILNRWDAAHSDAASYVPFRGWEGIS